MNRDWKWWEQYDETADELDAIARNPERAGADAPLLFRAADDIRTLTDGLKQREREADQR